MSVKLKTPKRFTNMNDESMEYDGGSLSLKNIAIITLAVGIVAVIAGSYMCNRYDAKCPDPSYLDTDCGPDFCATGVHRIQFYNSDAGWVYAPPDVFSSVGKCGIAAMTAGGLSIASGIGIGIYAEKRS